MAQDQWTALLPEAKPPSSPPDKDATQHNQCHGSSLTAILHQRSAVSSQLQKPITRLGRLLRICPREDSDHPPATDSNTVVDDDISGTLVWESLAISS